MDPQLQLLVLDKHVNVMGSCHKGLYDHKVVASVYKKSNQ